MDGGKLASLPPLRIVLAHHYDGCLHIQVNVAVVPEGPCLGKGEPEGLICHENTGVVEHSRVARDGMGRSAGISPDHDISHFDGQACRLKKETSIHFNDIDGVNDVTSAEPKSWCLG